MHPNVGTQDIINMHVVRRRLTRTILRKNAGTGSVSIGQPESRDISRCWEWGQVEGRKIGGDG